MSVGTFRPYSDVEDKALREGFFAGLSDYEISDKLAFLGFSRTAQSVKQRRVMHLKLDREGRRRSSQQIISSTGDAAFKRAMLNALSAGNEKAIIGVVKDRRPFTHKVTYQPEPTSSGCTSAAGMCVEAGDFAGSFQMVNRR